MKEEKITYKVGKKTIETDIVKVTFDNDDEWKEHRKDGIGGSEDGVLLGLVNPNYNTPLKWYQLKKGLIEPQKQNESMVRGHCLEDGIAKYFSAMTGLTILDNTADNIVYYRADAPHRRVTPDRFGLINGTKANSLDPSKRFILECKTHRGLITFDEDRGCYNYPREWKAQVMKGLGICGCSVGYIAWIDSSLSMNYEKIEFNEKDYKAICDVDDSYWEMFVNDIEPDPTTAEDIARKYPKEDSGKQVELSLEQQSLLTEISELNKDATEIKNKLDDCKDKLKMIMEDAESAVDAAGIVLATYKASNSFNENELKEQEPETYKKYLVEVFDKDAYKKGEGLSAYKKHCTSVGSRTLRVK